MWESLQAAKPLLFWIAGVSIIAFIATLIAVPWLIIRIPADYFAHRRRRRPSRPHTTVLWAAWAGKNLLGALLVLAGVIMLVLPGQGLLTILLGLFLLDIPGKYRLARHIVTRPQVLQVINRIRERAGTGPLLFKE
jgi:hypothetical protein